MDDMENRKGIRKTRIGTRNQRDEEVHINDSDTDSKSSSSKINQFFTRNKSLKILVSSDASKPSVPFSQTTSCKHPKFRQWQTVPIGATFT